MDAGPDRSSLDPAEVLRPLRRVHQGRQYTSEPVDGRQVDAVVDVGRWSGSSRNGQPWRFIVIRERPILDRLAELGAPSTRALATATAAIVVTMPSETLGAGSAGFDDGRASERMLISANLLGLAAAICWVPPRGREAARLLLGVPEDRVVRTMVAMGHPAPEAQATRTSGAPARLPRTETVRYERWDGPAALLDEAGPQDAAGSQDETGSLHAAGSRDEAGPLER